MSLIEHLALRMLAAYGVPNCLIHPHENRQHFSVDYHVLLEPFKPTVLVRVGRTHRQPHPEEVAMQITEAVLEHLTK